MRALAALPLLFLLAACPAKPLTPDEVREKLQLRGGVAVGAAVAAGVEVRLLCADTSIYRPATKSRRDVIVSTKRWRDAEQAGDIGRYLEHISSWAGLACASDDTVDEEIIKTAEIMRGRVGAPPPK